MTNYFDFNDAPDPAVIATPVDADAVRASLLARLEHIVQALYPNAVLQGGKAYLGNIAGERGDSLTISLDGAKRGQWFDFATQEGGDHVELFARGHGLSARTDFLRVLDLAAQWLGQTPVDSERIVQPAGRRETKPRNRSADDAPELGAPTAKWDYLAADGSLIACVYRFEPVPGKKQFRPWNVATGKFEGLDPRPLYNLPGIARSESVVLVEGEKCAQALIDIGICATTAMHGAKAPVDKTDWSPLVSKAVLIWPDKDKPGWDYAAAASEAITAAGADSVALLLPPGEKPENWDAADALTECFDVPQFLAQGERMSTHAASPKTADALSVDADSLGSGDSVWGSEDALALAFTSQYGEDWKYVALWGQWLVWTGPRWQPETTLRATDLIRGLCRRFALGAESPRTASKLASSGTVSGVERLARSDRRHAANAEEWDADPWRLNTANGVVDLRLGTLAVHARADRMTKLAQATLPQATASPACPTWMTFLHECTGGDVALQGYLQRICGYCLTGSTREHALFFLYGTGANGKSVFVNTLTAILADYATNAPMTMFMETRSDSHPTDLAGLRGARLVASVETEQGRRWNESKIKALTGGDKVSARFMRQDFFEYTPQFKLLIAGNHKPSIRNLDEAMRRRLQLIPFTITVPPERRDKQLEQKIWRERDAVLAWMLEGCKEWQRIGLHPPKVVCEATDEYFESEDAIGRWLAERCSFAANLRSLTCELFNDWKEWAELNGEFMGSQRRFSDALLTRRIEKWRNSVGARGFAGIALKVAKPLSTTHQPYLDN